MPKIGKPKKAQKTKKSEEKDVWDIVENETGGGGNFPEDANGFNEANTNFYLRDGEEYDIVLTTEDPLIISMHSMKKKIKGGKTVFPKKTCQKSKQKSCGYCSEAKTKSSSVNAARATIVWPLVSLDGFGDDEKPKPMIFVGMPKALALAIRKIKDELAEDEISIREVILTISKNNSTTTVDLKQVKKGKGVKATFTICSVDAEFEEEDEKDYPVKCTIDEYYEGNLPDVDVIHRVQTDDEVENELQYVSDSDD